MSNRSCENFSASGFRTLWEAPNLVVNESSVGDRQRRFDPTFTVRKMYVNLPQQSVWIMCRSCCVVDEVTFIRFSLVRSVALCVRSMSESYGIMIVGCITRSYIVVVRGLGFGYRS